MKYHVAPAYDHLTFSSPARPIKPFTLSHTTYCRTQLTRDCYNRTTGLDMDLDLNLWTQDAAPLADVRHCRSLREIRSPCAIQLESDKMGRAKPKLAYASGRGEPSITPNVQTRVNMGGRCGKGSLSPSRRPCPSNAGIVIRQTSYSSMFRRTQSVPEVSTSGPTSSSTILRTKSVR